MQETFFFSECDGDWFMVPAPKRKEWIEFTHDDFFDDQDKCDEFEEKFGEYRTGGGIYDIEFIVVKND